MDNQDVQDNKILYKILSKFSPIRFSRP